MVPLLIIYIPPFIQNEIVSFANMVQCLQSWQDHVICDVMESKKLLYMLSNLPNASASHCFRFWL